MSILSVRVIRRLLIGIIILVLLSVLINYLHTWYNRSHAVKEAAQILSADMMRSADILEYSQNQNGVVRFKIRAKRLLETRLGKNLLQGIEAENFNPDGSVHSEIRSQNAEYDSGRKLADFSGDVRIFIGKGIELRTNTLHYDQNTDISTTQDRLEFYSKEASGTARGVIYDQKRGLLNLASEVDFVLTQNGTRPDGSVKTKKLHATSERASFSDSAKQIHFLGNVNLQSESDVLSGNDIEAIMSPDRRRLTSLSSIGNAVYRSKDPSNMRSLSGERMIFDIGASSKALECINVFGNAAYLSLSPTDEEELRGAEIHLDLDSTKGLPKRIQSQAGVRLQMKRGMEQTVVSGGALDAKFVPGTKDLENVYVSKQAKMSTAGSKDTMSHELQAEEIRMGFRETEGHAALEKLRANGSVRWTFKPQESAAGRAQQERTIRASLLEMLYSGEGDFFESGRASGGVVMTATPTGKAAPAQIRRLQADFVRFHFYPGNNQLKDMNAEGHVQVAYEKESGPAGSSAVDRFDTSSGKMLVVFESKEEDNAISAVSQWENFTYKDAYRIATAGRCEYDARTEILNLKESPKISDEMGTTTGEEVEYDQAKKMLSVRGKVQSILKARDRGGPFARSSTSGSPGIVTAQEMRYWPEAKRARYEGKVQWLSEDSQLHAKILEIADGMERIDAQGDVMHLASMEELSGTRQDDKSDHRVTAGGTQNSAKTPFVVRSSSLQYIKERNAITYLGNVTLHSPDFDLSSASLVAILDKDQKNIEHATAHDNVLIHQGGRECKGEVADYYPGLRKLVVTGDPVEVYDPEKGRSFGRRLTSFAADDRIQLENR